MNPSKKSVAVKLRTLARNWSMTGVPDIFTCTIALYEAFGCDGMSTCLAFQTIADYLDSEGDYINSNQDMEWC